MRTTQIVLLIILSYIISSCTKTHERSNDFIPPLKIELSSILIDDPEITEFIGTTENKINKYSYNIEHLAIESRELTTKDEDSLSMVEVLKVAKTMLEFYSNNTQLQNTIEEFEEFINTQKRLERIDDLQTEALLLILLEIQHRSNLLERKYQFYYKK